MIPAYTVDAVFANMTEWVQQVIANPNPQDIVVSAIVIVIIWGFLQAKRGLGSNSFFISIFKYIAKKMMGIR